MLTSFRLNCVFPFIFEFSVFFEIPIAFAKLFCVYPASTILLLSLLTCIIFTSFARFIFGTIKY